MIRLNVMAMEGRERMLRNLPLDGPQSKHVAESNEQQVPSHLYPAPEWFNLGPWENQQCNNTVRQQ